MARRASPSRGQLLRRDPGRGQARRIRLVDEAHLVERLDERASARRHEMPAHDLGIQHVPVDALANPRADLGPDRDEALCREMPYGFPDDSARNAVLVLDLDLGRQGRAGRKFARRDLATDVGGKAHRPVRLVADLLPPSGSLLHAPDFRIRSQSSDH